MAIWRMNVFGDWGFGAGRCINSWHIRTGNLVTTEAAAVGNAAAAIRAFYASNVSMFPSLPANVSWKTDFAVNVQTGEDVVVDQTKFPPLLSTGGANAAPPHLAVCVGWKTSIRGRRARGRTFIGPLTTGVLENDGTVAAIHITNLSNAAQTLVNASLTDNDWAVGVWGLENPAPKDYTGDYNALPHVIRDITGYGIQDKFAVMRSRRP